MSSCGAEEESGRLTHKPTQIAEMADYDRSKAITAKPSYVVRVSEATWDFDRAAITISVRLIICELSQTVHDSCSREFMLHYF